MAALIESQVDPRRPERTGYRITGSKGDVQIAMNALTTGRHKRCRFIMSRLDGQEYGAIGEIIGEVP